MDSKFYVFVTLCIILFTILLYILYYYKFDVAKIINDVAEKAKKLETGPLSSLLNGSGINNIPNINIITTNSEIASANQCSKGPLFIGNSSTTSSYSDYDCIKICMNDSAKIMTVDENEELISESTILTPGNYCTIGPRPECNMNTSTAMITINSVVCRPKFPNLIGGTYGTTIIGCNNSVINDPNNVLWDNQSNTPVDPYTTYISDENELLSDGSYRFTCKYNGVDIRGNKYVPNPYNRFHPISNYCAALIYRAHPNVQTIISDDKSSYVCDCGDFEETRVRNIFENDPTSQCSNVFANEKNIIKSKTQINIPYKCFTVYSPITDVAKYMPCPSNQFTREGSQMSVVTIDLTDNPKALIEHPIYADFESDEKSGVVVLKDTTI